MNKLIVVVAIGALAAGCKRKKPEEAPMPPPAPEPAGSGSAGSGSAGSGSASTKPMTGDDLSKRFEQCWSYFNASKWDDFKACYTNDAVHETPGAPVPPATGAAAIADEAKQYKATFPDVTGDTQLELISGHTIIAVTLVHGTMQQPMKTPMGEIPATKNKIGLFTSQVIDVNDAGQATHEWEFVDMATMLAQMKPDPKMSARPAIDKLPMPKEVVIAKDDDKERANLAVAKKVVDAFSKHSVKDLGDVLADDAKWSEQPDPKDWDKKETLARGESFWKGFSDVKIVPDKQWAAGDYVATVGAIDGTNDGDVPEMHLKKTGKKIHVPFLSIMKIEGGKVKVHWIFDQKLAVGIQLGLLPGLEAPAVGSGSAAGSGSATPKK